MEQSQYMSFAGGILTDAPMPIETDRLFLRPLQGGDGKALCEAKIETWDSLSQTFRWAQGAPDIEQDEAYSKKSFENYLLHRDFNLVGVDKETNQHILYIGAHLVNLKEREFQMGYWVRQSAQKKGYAKEAAHALKSYVFNNLSAQRLVMCVTENNESSRKIINSLGLKLDGLRPKSLLCAHGELNDAYWFSLEKTPDLSIK